MTDTTVKTIQLTKEGLEELQKELKELLDVRLPAVIDRVAKAREYGDLSENSEYHSAREDQSLIEARIDEIETVLAKAEVVAYTKSKTKIGIGSTVVVCIKAKGKKGKNKTFTIVGDFESDPEAGKLSSTSPLGKALMDKKKGDVVTVEAPAGEVEYEIVEIK